MARKISNGIPIKICSSDALDSFRLSGGGMTGEEVAAELTDWHDAEWQEEEL